MQFYTTVVLGDGETFQYTGDDAARLVLQALGGTSTDFSQVSVKPYSLPDTGSAGTPPPTPPAA